MVATDRPQPTAATWERAYFTGCSPWQSSGLSDCARDLLTRHTDGGNLLEIGCGTGADIADLTSLGFDYTGIEWSPTAAKQASTLGNVVIGNFDEWSSSHAFDVIYDKGYFHGLQGVRARRRFSERLVTFLKPDGIWLTIAGTGDEVTFNRGAILARDLVYPAEIWFRIHEVRRSRYGVTEARLDFDAWHAVFRAR